MTPGDLRARDKNKSIRQEIEPKINFAAEFHGGGTVCMDSHTGRLRWSDWKIVLKSAEFKREDPREFVFEGALSSDRNVTGICRACDSTRVAS